jgi:hypothetical protein
MSDKTQRERAVALVDALNAKFNWVESEDRDEAAALIEAALREAVLPYKGCLATAEKHWVREAPWGAAKGAWYEWFNELMGRPDTGM